jgi:hypothetical protein
MDRKIKLVGEVGGTSAHDLLFLRVVWRVARLSLPGAAIHRLDLRFFSPAQTVSSTFLYMLTATVQVTALFVFLFFISFLSCASNMVLNIRIMHRAK